MNKNFQRSHLCIPYGLFLVCFVLAPLVVIIYYAFTNGEGKPTLENLTGFFSSPNTIGTLAYSLGIAVSTTCACLLLAYPIAYILARSKMKHKSVVLMVFVMPIYTTLLKLDNSLLEAAADLGADTLETFMKVTFPLSVPGIISGIVMVFLPSMTNYVVLDMLYNSTYIMGSLIGAYFSAYDWHNGSMIALILLVIILLFTLFTNRYADEDAGSSIGS